MRCSTLLAWCAAVLFALPTHAQLDRSNDAFPALREGLNYRNIGPFRGGRSAAVTGVKGQPMLFYMGTTGGGVWKTTNGGSTWENISDGYFGGSIGAVEVAPSNPGVIYVGGGECTVRGNVSPGTGMYKSVDGGRTWQDIGLKDSRHIPRVRVHPTNPDIVYAAVLGDLFKDSETRGVYKSTDGGTTWKARAVCQQPRRCVLKWCWILSILKCFTLPLGTCVARLTTSPLAAKARPSGNPPTAGKLGKLDGQRRPARRHLRHHRGHRLTGQSRPPLGHH